jgi:hypothetical protein
LERESVPELVPVSEWKSVAAAARLLVQEVVSASERESGELVPSFVQSVRSFTEAFVR